MTLADDVLRLTPDFRLDVESLMIDTAVITRPGSAPVFNPATGQLTAALGTVVYAGPCRLRQPTSAESEVLFGEEQVTRTTFIVCVPYATIGVKIADVVAVTLSGDPDVLSRRYKITAVPLSTFTIYKGYPSEVIE